MQEPTSDSAEGRTSEIQAAPLSESGASVTLSEPAKQEADFSTTLKKESAAAGTAKPWGGWGGWGSISTTLTGLAAATAKDLSDLSSNLQNVIVVDQPDKGASSSPIPVAAKDGRDASLVGAQELLETAEPSIRADGVGSASEATGEVDLTSHPEHTESLKWSTHSLRSSLGQDLDATACLFRTRLDA